jgi:hypothetical protein
MWMSNSSSGRVLVVGSSTCLVMSVVKEIFAYVLCESTGLRSSPVLCALRVTVCGWDKNLDGFLDLCKKIFLSKNIWGLSSPNGLERY